MNCCDEFGECRQGRDCPVRVARVGKRTHAKEALPPNPWRRQLRIGAKWLLTVLALLFYAALAAALLSRN